jgi:hypothetical protein
MGEKVVTFGERFFFMMVWVIIVLAAAGFLIHFAQSKGVLPGFLQSVLGYTDLSQQAGG